MLPEADITSEHALAVVEHLEEDFERIAMSTYERMLALLPKNKSPWQRLRLPYEKIFLGKAPLERVPLVTGDLLDWTEEEMQLTDQQRQAITNVYEYPFSCVHGPPGSGKSKTIVATVRSLLQSTNRDIMVLTSKQVSVEDLTRVAVMEGHRIRSAASSSLVLSIMTMRIPYLANAGIWRSPIVGLAALV
jgi:hypothetical protein